MELIERAWKTFFGQFVPHVFAEGELIQDPSNTLYPRITFSYQTADFFSPAAAAFQVWTWSHNNAELWEVCGKIAKAVPVGAGASVVVPGGVYYEYRHPESGEWSSFELYEFQGIADSFAPEPLEWRQSTSGPAGGIEIWRGSPFLTPRRKDEAMSRVMYGTLQAKYFNTI